MSRYHPYALPYYVDDILDATTTPHVDASGTTNYQLFWGNPQFNGTN
ncbi:MAG: hypothetical protein JO021_26120, partial [Alphaproteobacteria bacterium]|nr:hypothetical protein [Alphaproteobacteria bacterium]